MTGEELRAKRLALGMKPTEFAFRMGISTHSLMSWELGYRGVPRIAEIALASLERDVREGKVAS